MFLCLVLRAVDLVFQVLPLSDECPGVCQKPLFVLSGFLAQKCFAGCCSDLSKAVPMFFNWFFWELGKHTEPVSQLNLELFCLLFHFQVLHVVLVRWFIRLVFVGLQLDFEYSYNQVVI